MKTVFNFEKALASDFDIGFLEYAPSFFSQLVSFTTKMANKSGENYLKSLISHIEKCTFFCPLHVNGIV